MSQVFTSLGLMTGTSGDGLDISLMKSDGETFFDEIEDKFVPYSENIKSKYLNLREKINKKDDIQKYQKAIGELERDITLFHANNILSIFSKTKISSIDIIGFHGQTIYHNSKEKLSLQIGNGNLLSQLLLKKVVVNFRKNDLKNNGVGAPLTPIFHKIIMTKLQIETPVIFLNLGGVANVTLVNEDKIYSSDIGPGNCLIDKWIKKKTNKNFDKLGSFARSGKIDKIIFEQAIDQWFYKFKDLTKKNISFDINDFDISFVRGLELNDGAATLTEYTSEIIAKYLDSLSTKNIIVCGGGRKNQYLIERISNKISKPLKNIDNFGLDGDYIESKAFAYLAIRSIRITNIISHYNRMQQAIFRW